MVKYVTEPGGKKVLLDVFSCTYIFLHIRQKYVKYN